MNDLQNFYSALQESASKNGQTNQQALMAFANAGNTLRPYSFNTVDKPEWFDGTYNWTQIRPMGATYLHPEGLQAAYDKGMSQNSLDGILGVFAQNPTGA